MEVYRKLSAAASTEPNEQNFKALLENYPLLYGYWIKYALSQFHISGTKRAEETFERAVEACKYSSELWVAYIRFKIETNSPKEAVKAVCVRGANAAGNQFLSHNLWDVLIEYAKTHETKFGFATQQPDLAPVEEILYHILKSKTLHQFSRYYKSLKEVTKLDESHLVELYGRQQTRVSKVWRYERSLKRPFFHPEPLGEQERKVWVNYLDFITTSEKENLFNRALEIDPYNEQLWLRYIRWVIADGEMDPEQFFIRADKYLPKPAIELRLYYAFWLELYHPERVDDCYLSLQHNGRTFRQYSQYLERKGEDGVKLLRDNQSQMRDADAVEILAELLRYDKEAFATSRRNSIEFYRGWLKHQPERADEIWEKAAVGSIDDAYLLALRRTDMKKFVEMERALKR